jgi:hypothetical protein
MTKPLAALALALAGEAALAQAPEPTLRCTLTKTDFVYDCVATLVREGKPLTGAQFTVAADMPSMPGAHATVPARAAPGGKPGQYRLTLDLEMMGEWALEFRFTRPAKARVRQLYEFGEAGATRSGRLPRN